MKIKVVNSSINDDAMASATPAVTTTASNA